MPPQIFGQLPKILNHINLAYAPRIRVVRPLALQMAEILRPVGEPHLCAGPGGG